MSVSSVTLMDGDRYEPQCKGMESTGVTSPLHSLTPVGQPANLNECNRLLTTTIAYGLLHYRNVNA